MITTTQVSAAVAVVSDSSDGWEAVSLSLTGREGDVRDLDRGEALELIEELWVAVGLMGHPA